MADEIVRRDTDLAARMLTQSKQIGLILDATLARLDAGWSAQSKWPAQSSVRSDSSAGAADPHRGLCGPPSCSPALTALRFAALLPPDTIPWPWLRALTEERHPELREKDDLGADRWLPVQRRLTGLRLLTPGDHVEVARIHRLVAAHVERSFQVVSPPFGDPSGSAGAAIPRPEKDLEGSFYPSVLEAHLAARAWAIYDSQATPAEWELDALLTAAPHWLTAHPVRDLANASVFLSEKLLIYRTLPAAAAFLATVHDTLTKLAESDPANAAWQRDLSVSFNKLGDLARAQGNLPEAQRLFGEDLRIAQRLAESDPANAAWQRDLFYSCYLIATKVFQPQNRWAEALALMEKALRISERLAASAPTNVMWQNDVKASRRLVAELRAKAGR